MERTQEQITEMFPLSDLRFGQFVGLSWEPWNQPEFFVFDIRQIIEARSGQVAHEYKLARKLLNRKEYAFTDWVPRDRLFIPEVQTPDHPFIHKQ